MKKEGERTGAAATRAKTRYNSKNYKQLAIRMRPEDYAELESMKNECGCSWSDLVMRGVDCLKKKTKNESGNLMILYHDLFDENEKNKSRARIAVFVSIAEFILLAILLAVH